VTPATCGSAPGSGNGVTIPSTVQNEIVNGVLSAYCKASVVDSQSMPFRSIFPTSQLRFSSRYFDKFAMNGRAAYSAGRSQVVNYNFTQIGYDITRPSYNSTTKTWSNPTGPDVVGGIMTPSGTVSSNPNVYSNSPRTYINADMGAVAELTKRLSISDTLSYASIQTSGTTGFQTTLYKLADPQTNLATEPSMFTAINAAGVVPTTTVSGTSSAPSQAAGLPWWLNQTTASNTLLGSFIASPKIKVSAGYRFKTRKLNYLTNSGFVPTTDMVWHQNDGLFGAVIEPSRVLKLNVNYDVMTSGSANTHTASNTFTRSQPDASQRLKVRGVLKPNKAINFFATANVYTAKNDDPFVNGKQHSQDYSFATSIMPMEGLSFDLNYSYDEVYSVTDSCYGWAYATTTATTPPDGFSTPPYGGTISATCSNVNSSKQGSAPTSTLATSSFYYFNNYYKAPSSFFMGAINYSPVKVFHFSGGVRMNAMHGTADLLNPIQTPGTLDSRTLMPFADAEFKVAQQWAWHGNYSYNGYGEQGIANAVVNGVTSNGLPSRNNHGNVLTLGVKYAF
jgi:hypothetical protein